MLRDARELGEEPCPQEPRITKNRKSQVHCLGAGKTRVLIGEKKDPPNEEVGSRKAPPTLVSGVGSPLAPPQWLGLLASMEP